MEKKKASWSIYTYICWYKAVFSRLVCMALVSVQDTIVWAFAEPCVRDARLYCIYLYYFWKAVKWKWFVTMFHVNSNKGSCNRFRLVFLGCSHCWWGGWRVGWLLCVFKFISSIEHMPVSYKGILVPSHRKHCNMQYTSLLFFFFFWIRQLSVWNTHLPGVALSATASASCYQISRYQVKEHLPPNKAFS